MWDTSRDCQRELLNRRMRHHLGSEEVHDGDAENRIRSGTVGATNLQATCLEESHTFAVPIYVAMGCRRCLPRRLSGRADHSKPAGSEASWRTPIRGKLTLLLLRVDRPACTKGAVQPAARGMYRSTEAVGDSLHTRSRDKGWVGCSQRIAALKVPESEPAMEDCYPDDALSFLTASASCSWS